MNSFIFPRHVAMEPWESLPADSHVDMRRKYFREQFRKLWIFATRLNLFFRRIVVDTKVKLSWNLFVKIRKRSFRATSTGMAAKS